MTLFSHSTNFVGQVYFGEDTLPIRCCLPAKMYCSPYLRGFIMKEGQLRGTATLLTRGQ